MGLLSYVFDLTRKHNHIGGRIVASALINDQINRSGRIALNKFRGVSTEVAFSNFQINMLNTVDKYIITTLKHAIATIQDYTLGLVQREYLLLGSLFSVCRKDLRPWLPTVQSLQQNLKVRVRHHAQGTYSLRSRSK